MFFRTEVMISLTHNSGQYFLSGGLHKRLLKTSQSAFPTHKSEKCLWNSGMLTLGFFCGGSSALLLEMSKVTWLKGPTSLSRILSEGTLSPHLVIPKSVCIYTVAASFWVSENCIITRASGIELMWFNGVGGPWMASVTCQSCFYCLLVEWP